ncbi:protein of unknown function DUF405 [Cellulomonas flavigena DSM 20109]|uniref:DUF418 domain-containing protein n=1 Tax=Cellulomonas flavigena (strain ATCC 482 / DSM 20109 / BCRC 11376 / JCM 18109 / NBRC 3775 / NCIMB 8073 / NRS 134) TaxID=446466 RepID=D5UCJ9_CELFN|nr:DUF418 domain-containing protein [Cellulomonas flavigena]ADG74313.1 protein of unknown function DUF405 [Cellulomonas flavigena DSM 20109]
MTASPGLPPQAAPVPPAAAHVAPVPPSQRAVAPDVARGLALLGIALANAVAYFTGLGSRPVDSTTLDRAVNGLVSLFVDRRTMPMFALLYGYGIGVVVRRRTAAGVPWPVVRGDLRRRSGVLVAFGAVHIALLFEGDILASYGLAGLLAVVFVRAKDRALLVVAVVLAVAAVAMGHASLLALSADTGAAEVPPDTGALAALVSRTVRFATAPIGAVVAVPLVLVGLWAARREVLERPADHLALLRRTALVGLAVSVLGGLPQATIAAGLREAPRLEAYGAAALHQLTGVAGGLAFAALVGWAVAARGTTLDTLSPAGRALRAVGQRSMTCYLLQSVLFVLPLAPWAGALGVGMSAAQVAAWAVGVWLVTVAVAVGLEATGRRGPAEALYRRLVYRPVTA